MLRRERLSVVATEAVGPYTLLRVERGAARPRHAGPVLHARGAGPAAAAPDEPLRSRPPGELAFLIDPIGPGTRALC